MDFATNLGPKLLVATGALAFIIFLGLFVKYAWDNDWVGPTGRVLIGAVTGLGLLAGGLRLLDREYRPLGQGLAAAGLVGLYTSAFAAHGFYDLIPRSAAGVLMLGITASAVVLAARLNTRLLAALAWLGAYLVPFLLSTGEDKALSLYLYLALLAAGALVLDHRRPWPETVPLAMAGTFVLYAGWYGQFFRPERFEIAALGIVLFTALFALGMARKEREVRSAAVFGLGAFGLTVLAGGADRPRRCWSSPWPSRALRCGPPGRSGPAVLRGRHRGRPAVRVLVPRPLPAGELRPGGGVDGGRSPSVRAPRLGGAAPVALEGVVLAGGGLAAVVLCAQTNRPLPILGLLLAQAGIALLARNRWPWAYVEGSRGPPSRCSRGGSGTSAPAEATQATSSRCPWPACTSSRSWCAASAARRR